MAGKAASRFPRLRRVSRTLLFLAVSVGIGLGLLEVVLRLFLPQPLVKDASELWTPDPLIGWRHRPNVRVTYSAGEGDVEVCTDAEGYRVSCLTEPAADCPKHILVLGDSFVASLLVPYEQTVWHLLEKETGACVHVGGVVGYNPAQILQSAREHLAEGIKFDLVIVNIYEGNDFDKGAGVIPAPKRMFDRPVRLLPAGLSRRDLSNWIYPLNQALESRSHVWVALRNVVRTLQYRRPPWITIFRSKVTPKILDAALAPVRATVEEAQSHGARVLIVLVPIHMQILDATGEGLRAAHPEIGQDLDMDLGSKRIMPRLTQLGVPVVDLTPGMRARASRSLWGTYDFHFSEEGHRVRYDLIKDDVENLLGLTPGDNASTPGQPDHRDQRPAVPPNL